MNVRGVTVHHYTSNKLITIDGDATFAVMAMAYIVAYLVNGRY